MKLLLVLLVAACAGSFAAAEAVSHRALLTATYKPKPYPAPKPYTPPKYPPRPPKPYPPPKPYSPPVKPPPTPKPYPPPKPVR